MPRVVDLTDKLARAKIIPLRHPGIAVDTAWVHHSATANSCTATIIADYHVKAHGWPSIGYHRVIYPNGTIAITLPVTNTGYNVACKEVVDGVSTSNWRGVGICLIGNFIGGKQPTPSQLASLEWLIEALDLPIVHAHAESDIPSECPGQNYQAWLNPIRDRYYAKRAAHA